MLRSGQSVSVKNPCLFPNQCNLFFLTHAGRPTQNALFLLPIGQLLFTCQSPKLSAPFLSPGLSNRMGDTYSL